MYILEIITFAFLAVAAATDMKSGRIPPGLFPALLPAAFVLKAGLFGPDWPVFLITGFAVTAGMLVTALAGKTGGGDLIMLGSIALCLGPSAVFVIFAGMLAGFALTGVYRIAREKSFHGGIRAAMAMSVPLSPYALAGYALYIAVKYQLGGMPV